MLWDFFYYTRQQRRGVLCLLVILLAGIGVYMYLVYSDKPGRAVTVESSAEIDSFLVHLETAESHKRGSYSHNYKKAVPAPAVVLEAFDPNTADSATFRRLGLPAFTASNIIKYREKGGVFRTPESLAKIYGMTDELYQTLSPYIVIGDEYIRRDTVRLAAAAVRDTIVWPEKYPEGTVVELNGCDTAELKKIPGIGSGIARMIVAYRDKLGGFCSTGQLMEISYIDSTMLRWFTIDTGYKLRKLEVNRASLDRLRNHPYMDFYKAKVIIEHRRRRGKIRSLAELGMYKEFSDKDTARLKPYLSFE